MCCGCRSRKPKPSPMVIPAGGQPSHVDAKIASVQTTTSSATAKMFAPVAPAPVPRKAETVAIKLPEERPKSKVEDSPPPALKPKVTAKVEESAPAPKPKVTAKVEEQSASRQAEAHGSEGHVENGSAKPPTPRRPVSRRRAKPPSPPPRNQQPPARRTP